MSYKLNCPFCETYRIKSTIIDYGDVMVFEPLNPVVAGHVLVVPKKHIDDFTEDGEVMAKVSQVASQIAKARGGDYNLITSKGVHATQSVKHLHIHLVPRREGDGLKLPWS